MPTAYPASYETEGDASETGSEPLDANEASYIDITETTGGDDALIRTTWTAAGAITAVPYLRLQTSDDVDSPVSGAGTSEERFSVVAYDAATSGDDLFVRWQGAIAEPDTLTTVDLGTWPRVDTDNDDGSWTTYLNGSAGASDDDDFRTALAAQLASGGLVMEVGRNSDSVSGRSERSMRVVEWGVVYSTATGGTQPLRIFQRPL